MKVGRLAIGIAVACLSGVQLVVAPGALAADPTAPAPLLGKGQPVDWWFVFKFNASSFPACGGAQRQCIFGGEPREYSHYGQQFAYASANDRKLQMGSDCLGDSVLDPVGATFDQIYNGRYNFVVWNDQFYDDPKITGCTKSCGAPWGHSKGVLAWNEQGEGLVLQVSTPSWPAAGSSKSPRMSDGNTLGCVIDPNVEVSQHFFSLKLDRQDVLHVLEALENASAVTNPEDPQIVHNGGPADIQAAVRRLGKRSVSTTWTKVALSVGGVELISKPSRLPVPPWQMVSAVLGGVPLRVASWWAKPWIYTTTDTSSIACWDQSLGEAGPVEIATTGHWQGREYGLKGGSGPNFNHAKIGVSMSGNDRSTIFGDMNQQGSVSPAERPCKSSQNGRGGLFYVLRDQVLHDQLVQLIEGDRAPTHGP
jgi:hypothetical protein